MSAQQKLDISGTVKDSSGSPLPGATVLLSGYQIGNVANATGNFKIAGLGPGKYDLLVQMIGYLPAQIYVPLDGTSTDITIVLKEKVNLLKEIVIKPDPNRPYYLKQFKETFLGTSPNARLCKIINPEVLDFDYDEKGRVLTAKTKDFLIIENRALGYRIKYLLKYFEKNDASNIIAYFGFPHFEELHSSQQQIKALNKQRQKAYEGSSQHFFAALYQNKFENSGFVINKLFKKKNPRKLPDSVINERIDYYGKLAAKSASWMYTDSLDHYDSLKNEPDTLEVINPKAVQTDTLVHTVKNGLKALMFDDALYVIFKKEKESRGYKLFSEYQLPRPSSYSKMQVSILHRDKQAILFYENGSLDNPISIVYEGYWGYEKIADLMPIDYKHPVSNSNPSMGL